MLELIQNGKLLGQINATVIALIPKVKSLDSPSQYRCISCCNMLYKVISKALCQRLRRVLPSLISNIQAALVDGRSLVYK